MKVIFEPLPREPLLKLVIRKILRRTPRKEDFIFVSLNGRSVICPRGIALEVPAWVVAVVGSGARCYLLLDKETGKNLAAIEAMQ